MKIKIFIAITLLIRFCGLSQDCTDILSGQVIDYHNKSPLEKATILIVGTQNVVETNDKGKFQILDLCSGEYELRISHPDCSTVFIEVNVDGITWVDVKLEHHIEELEEVKVVGDVLANKTNSALEESLKLSELEQYSSGSLGDALKELNGVSSLNTGANIVKPAIHGLNGSRILILNDGVRMQDMEWGDEHAPNIDINSAGSISVVKGASALQYGGDAIGGVILMEQARIPSKDTLYGKTLINGLLNGRGGNITSGLTKVFNKGWFLKGQGSYKRLGDQEAPDYVLSNTGTKEIGVSVQFGKQLFTWGWDARYSFYTSEIAVLRASHIGSVDDLIRAINSGEPQVINPFTYELQNPRQEVTHHLGKIKAYKRFVGLGKWNFQYDYQNNRRLEFDVRRGDRDNQASIDLELTTHTITSDFKWDAKEKYQFQFGLLGRYQENFPNPETGVRRLIPDYEKYDFGAFITGEYRLNDQILVDAGIRYDFSRIDAQKFYQTSRWEERGYATEFQDLIVEDRGTQLLVNPVFDFNNFSGTVGFKYSKNDANVTRLNYAIAKRAPNPSELFSDGLHHSAARIELGDLNIQSETSHKTSFSYQRQFKQWGFTLEPYGNFIKDFILLEPTGVEFTIRGAFPVWEYRQTDARLLGIDFSSYIDWTKNWKTEHRFSLVKGKDIDRDAALINIPAVSFRNKIVFSRPEWNGFEAFLESQYVFRQNEVLENFTVFSPSDQEDVFLEINTPPDAYHLVAVGAKKGFQLKKNLKLTTSLTINNLLNTKYRDYLNRQRFYADDLGRNITLQLKLNY